MVRTRLNIIVLLLIGICLSSNSIDIITTNDMHGFIDEQNAQFINPHNPPLIIGGSGFIKYVNDLKNELNNEVLILDGGNFFQGNPLGIIDSGKTMIDWMNKVGYHAIVPGNYDFLFGIENLISLSELSEFSFLAANLYSSKSNELIFDPYKIFNIKEVNVGIIGIVNSNLEDIVLENNLKGIRLEPPINTLKTWVPIMKNKGADIIIMLTSFGVPWDREEIHKDFIDNLSNSSEISNAIELGYYSNEVDVIISGGISKGYDSPWYDPYSHTFIFQNYGNGTSFGHFQIEYDNDTKLFSGFDYEVKNKISQTLFLNDFDYDKDAYDWIKNNSVSAINNIYQSVVWTETTESDKANIVSFQTEDNWDVPTWNIDDNFDIITWNCEFFPAAGDSTIKALSEIVSDLDVEIIAFQEIKNRGWFSKLMKRLPDYSFIISQQSSFMDQAIIYKKNEFTLVSRVELFAEDDYNFAGRPPLQANFIDISSNKQFSVINLHMKCCDSGLLRRQKASLMLYEYLKNEINNNINLIVLGDWNDDLKDADGEHCFAPYLEDDKFFFPTWDLTYDLNKASYPKEPYVSFLDHIMITKEFLKKNDYVVDTVPIDRYMGNYDVYEKYISDHMPIYLSFQF